MTSLQRKITLGYVFFACLALGVALLHVLDLRLLEARVLSGDKVNELLDMVLEIRRFEKNYFLYRKQDDARECLDYVSRAQTLLDRHGQDFAKIATGGSLEAFSGDLVRYGGLMAGYAANPHFDGGDERAIRELGNRLVTVAETWSQAQRRMFAASLERHRQNLLASVVVLVVLLVLTAAVLTRRVTRPLEDMERSMEAVARGDTRGIQLASGDREIESLRRAFNHVLRELEMRQRHLVHSEKLASLGTLLSGVAHEINNPLSNISTSAQILIEDEGTLDPAYRRELVEQIDQETERARRIVRSLLDYARSRDFRREEQPLLPLVQETLRFIKGETPANVGLVLDIAEDLTVFADKPRLQQVFVNLLKNAMAAMPGGGTVEIGAQVRRAGDPAAPAVLRELLCCDEDRDVVDIHVLDTGSGIAPEVLPRIFDPFFSTKEVGKGSGLGLFIVHELVADHEGCITVESAPGRGTVFHIRLPRPVKEPTKE